MKRTGIRRGTGGLARSAPLGRSASIARSALDASAPTRDWRAARAKVDAEGRCRVCGAHGQGVKLDAAHTIGREHDRKHGSLPDALWVDPADVVPLCAGAPDREGCHPLYDARVLDLLPYLTHAEQAAAVAHVGIVAALRRLTSSRTLDRTPV